MTTFYCPSKTNYLKIRVAKKVVPNDFIGSFALNKQEQITFLRLNFFKYLKWTSRQIDPTFFYFIFCDGVPYNEAMKIQINLEFKSTFESRSHIKGYRLY